MSLSALMNTTINIRRKSATRDTSGGQVENFNDVLVGLPALIQDRHGKAARMLGQRQVLVTHVIYLTKGYNILRGDVAHEPASGRTFFVHGFENMGGQSQAWRLETVEET